VPWPARRYRPEHSATDTAVEGSCASAGTLRSHCPKHQHPKGVAHAAPPGRLRGHPVLRARHLGPRRVKESRPDERSSRFTSLSSRGWCPPGVRETFQPRKNIQSSRSGRRSAPPARAPPTFPMGSSCFALPGRTGDLWAVNPGPLPRAGERDAPSPREFARAIWGRRTAHFHLRAPDSRLPKECPFPSVSPC